MLKLCTRYADSKPMLVKMAMGQVFFGCTKLLKETFHYGISEKYKLFLSSIVIILQDSERFQVCFENIAFLSIYR